MLRRYHAALLLASLGFVTDAGADVAPPRAVIDTGVLRGTTSEGVTSFKGIPFAAPPVGDLRWRAPQPAARWTAERNATRYGPDCMQKPFPSDAAPLGTTPAEDCLYANVWRPAGNGRRLPVLVWIYGGGFVNGGASPPTYAGAALARQGILVVSFNYRLGRFGTFAHPSLIRADADHGLVANYGYLDQLAALRWVRRNAAAFGGDPANVTIMGESAGGMSVHALITSPMAAGLFAKAIVESGGPVEPAATLASAEQASLAYARGRGIADDDPGALAKLRGLSAADVVDNLNLATTGAPTKGPKTFSSPVADGRIAVDAMAAYRAGRFARVPMMVGATSDDIGGPTGFMIAGARKIAAEWARQGLPAYHYRFSYVATSVRSADTKGAAHATDIPFFFNTADVKYGAATTTTDRAAARVASGYVVNFVKHGDPNGDDLPRWPRYDVRTPAVMNLTADGGAAEADR